MVSMKVKFLTALFFGLLCFPGFPLQATSSENQITFQFPLGGPLASDSTAVDYLIITSEKFEANLERLALWKLQRGLNVALITVEEIYATYSGRDQPEQIKSCIDDFYTNNQTEWVLLGGDHDQVPVRYARIYDGYAGDGDYVVSDSYYSDLDHNWDSNDDGLWGTDPDEWDMDSEVYVGRLTAATTAEMSSLVANIITYERSPPVGDWMINHLWAGAMLFFDADFDGDDESDYDEIDANRFNAFLGERNPGHITNTFLGETAGLAPSQNHTDRALTWENLQDEINQGAGFGSITGHGWPQGMVRTVFVEDKDGDDLFDYNGDPIHDYNTPAIDVDDNPPLINVGIPLDPGYKLGFYYLGGCSVGSFDHNETSLQEYFLHNAAIGAIGGSEVVWGEDFWTERPHGGWYSEGLQARFWEQLLVFNQPGKALAVAKFDMMFDRNDLAEPAIYPEWEEKILKQFNLLGDPEISLWMDIPDILEVFIDNQTSTTETNITVVSSGDDLPVQDVIITVTNDSSRELIWRGLTNASGSVDIPLSPEVANNFSITAAKTGYIPWISFEDDIVIETPSETPTETEPEPDPKPGLFDNIPGYSLGTLVFAVLAVTMILVKKPKYV
ncbi:MAG: C25 family cysteine peptidase [Promethearchaeota archaeon]